MNGPKAFIKVLLNLSFTMTFFGVMFFLLGDRLSTINWNLVWQNTANLSIKQLVAAVGLTGLSYLALSFYDRLAIVYLGQQTISRLRIVTLISFLSYAINFNLGALIGGVAIRLRYYRRNLKFSFAEVGQLTVFCGLTSWVGYSLVAGLVWSAALLMRRASPEGPSLNGFGADFISFEQWFGLSLTALLIPLLYLIGGWCQWRLPAIKGRRFALPNLRLMGDQLLVSAVQWSIVPTIIFVILPEGSGITWIKIASVYLVAAVAGLIAHIPAGIGVIESVFLLALPSSDSEILLGTLIIFRTVYYLLPLVLAVPVAVYLEATKERIATPPDSARSMDDFHRSDL